MSRMKARPKHLSCIAISSFHLAASQWVERLKSNSAEASQNNFQVIHFTYPWFWTWINSQTRTFSGTRTTRSGFDISVQMYSWRYNADGEDSWSQAGLFATRGASNNTNIPLTLPWSSQDCFTSVTSTWHDDFVMQTGNYLLWLEIRQLPFIPACPGPPLHWSQVNPEQWTATSGWQCPGWTAATTSGSSNTHLVLLLCTGWM